MMAIRRRKQVIPDTESTQKVYNYSAADKDFASKRAKPNQTLSNLYIYEHMDPIVYRICDEGFVQELSIETGCLRSSIP
jgi:hypothetical protein